MNAPKGFRAGALLVCLCSAVPAMAGGTPLTTERVAGGLVRPIFAGFAPGDYTRLYIIEKQGRVRVLNLKTGHLQSIADAFLDIDTLVGGGTSTNAETGLLGLAFHPDYQVNGHFYVNYTNTALDTVVARYTVSTPDAADLGSAATILTIDQPQGNHNGGWLGFGPNDGYLYIATGDGGSACDSGIGHTSGTGNGQDITDNLLGKILRIDVDGGSPYAVPADNPFVGITGDDEIWAYGFRNPWRASFDRATGDLFIADVGQDAREEISYQPASSTGGENYGWRCMEGNGCSSASGCSTTGCTCGDAALRDPLHDYTHNPPPPPAGFVCAVVGGYVYRGCAIPDLDGAYFFADYCGDAIWSFEVFSGHVVNFTDRTAELAPAVGDIASITSFGEDALGQIYICDQDDGEVFKIIPASYVVPFTDIDCDLVVGIEDLLDLLAAWGPCDGCAADVDGDGIVGIVDFLLVLADWGSVI